MRSLVGKNALTVFLSKSEDDGLKMFFCPYTRNNVSQYLGNVEIIYPSYDTLRNPSVIIRPQKLSRNIHYIFTETSDKTDSVSFWLQYRQFENTSLQSYYCHNCQAPQLYFSDEKAVNYKDKTELKDGDNYICSNPLCKQKLKYMGIVSISLPDIINNG